MSSPIDADPTFEGKTIQIDTLVKRSQKATRGLSLSCRAHVQALLSNFAPSYSIKLS
jgi:hypothetical protein